MGRAITADAVPIGWAWRTDAPMIVSPSGRRSRSRLIVGMFLSACVAGAVALVCGFFWFVASVEHYEAHPLTGADGIVVLTGGSQRIPDAIDLLAKGYGTRLLISGVNEKTSRAEIARLNPGQRRLFDCCVDLDYRARNTIGNAIETRRWMMDQGFRSLIVVTSNYHMPRTLLELDHALPAVRKVPYAVVPSSVAVADWWSDATSVRLLGTEYLKFLAVWVRTLVENDPEKSSAALLMSRFQAPVKVVAGPLTR